MLPSSPTLAAWEARLRPLLVRLPPAAALALYASGRRWFLRRLVEERPDAHTVPEALGQTLWGVRFRAPLLNAAGMFKHGDGYEMAARQGAGAWLAGTTTATPRKGNHRHGVHQPFVPYPRSRAASNWLGLPNPGHAAVAEKLRRLPRTPGCPVGASLTFDIDDTALGCDVRSDEPKLDGLVAGLERYADVGVDFVEINESCPNTEESPLGLSPDEELRQLTDRLAQIRDRFLDRRGAGLPVLVKLSCDTDPDDIPGIVDGLVRLGFAGVNFGNTSKAYTAARLDIVAQEQPLFDRFVRDFGGGVSGRPLRARSLRLVELAAAHLQANPPPHEFHLVRTGGVETAGDVQASREAGAPLCQWYTGTFDALARHGHELYRRLYEDLLDES